MPVRTRKMVAANAAAVESGYGITQVNSLASTSTRHFVSFEDSLPATTVADIKTSGTFADNAVDTDLIIDSAGDANSIRFGSESGSVAVTTPAWASPGTDDWMFFAVIRAIEDPSTPGDGYACYIEAGVQGASGNSVGIFPYMMRFQDIVGTGVERPVYTKDASGAWSYQTNGIADVGYPVNNNGGWWCDNCSGWNLVDGQVYSVGGCKRGDWMEHYFDGVLVGKINVASFAAEHGFATTQWDNWTPGAGLEVSHSGYTGVGCDPDNTVATVGHWPAEYYGLMMSSFADGCPSQNDLEEAMQWMKTQWIAGNKVIAPHFSTRLSSAAPPVLPPAAAGNVFNHDMEDQTWTAKDSGTNAGWKGAGWSDIPPASQTFIANVHGAEYGSYVHEMTFGGDGLGLEAAAVTGGLYGQRAQWAYTLGATDTGGTTVDINGAEYNEVWCQQDLYIPSNYFHRVNTEPGLSSNNKGWLYMFSNGYNTGENQQGPGMGPNLWPIDDSNGGSYMSFYWWTESNQGGGHYKQGAYPTGYYEGIFPADFGHWIRITSQYKTTGVTNTGTAKIWKRRDDESTARLICDIDGVGPWPEAGEKGFMQGYILGAANSSFHNTTTFLNDNVRFGSPDLGGFSGFDPDA